MAAELLIATNPARRRKRKFSAKQRAAALRNLKKARGSRKRRRRTNPVAANPTRRRKRRRSFARSMRRRRTNPSFSLRRLSPQALMRNVMPALVGGAGGVANDLLYNAALNVMPDTMPFKDQLTTGALRHVGKAASAMLLSVLAGMVLPRRIADQIGTGALVVVGYNVAREAVAKIAPDVAMGMYLKDPSSLGWSGAGWNPTYGSDYRKSGLSAYLRTNGNGNGGNPGSVRVPSQFNTRDQFGARAAAYETGT